MKYIVPFVFVYNSALLMEGDAAFIIFSFATAFVGTIALSAAMEGFLLTFLSPLSRIAILAGSVLLLISHIPSDIAGIILLASGVTINYRSMKKARRSEGNLEVAG